NPPNNERQADPDPCLATFDNSSSVTEVKLFCFCCCCKSIKSYKLAKVYTKHANPDAEDANPAAVGKLFSEHICKLYSDKGITLTSFPSSFSHLSSCSLRKILVSLKQFCNRLLLVVSCSTPLSHNLVFLKVGEARIVVLLCNWSCDNVTDND